MKICIVSHSAADDGGAERVLIETVEVLQEAGLECLVVFPEQGPLVLAVAERGAECMVLGSEPWVRGEATMILLRRLNAARSYICAALKLAFFLVRNPCDMVITNTIVLPVGALAATLLRVPHVWWIHEFGEEDHGLRFDLGIRSSTWFMGRTSVIVLVSSAAVASKYSNYIDRGKLRLVHYSVHMNFDGAQEGQAELWPVQTAKAKHKVCIVGSISESKGQQDAIRAMEKLHRGGIDAALVLVGSTGSYSDQLKDLSKELGIENQVQFTGHVANPLPIVSSCDVAIVCSRCEAFGRVTVEAMKLGNPSWAHGPAELWS